MVWIHECADTLASVFEYHFESFHLMTGQDQIGPCGPLNLENCSGIRTLSSMVLSQFQRI
jgi:hypothetical protein